MGVFGCDDLRLKALGMIHPRQSDLSFRNDPPQTERPDLLCDSGQVASLLWAPVDPAVPSDGGVDQVMEMSGHSLLRGAPRPAFSGTHRELVFSMPLLVPGRLRPCSQADAVRQEASNCCLGAPQGQAVGPSIWRASLCALLSPWGPQWNALRHGWLKAGPPVFPEPVWVGAWLAVCLLQLFFFKVTFWEV